MNEWINVKDEPIPEGRFLTGLMVRNNKTNLTAFEYYDLVFDGDEIRIPDDYGDYFSDWEKEDFTHWIKIEPPKGE